MKDLGLSFTDTADYKGLFFEQKLALHFAMTKRNMLITGGGGVGKSHLIKVISRLHRDVVLCASTGIAGLNIGGTTIDDFMGFNSSNTDAKSVRRMNNNLKEKLKLTSCLLIDESSMTRIDKLDAIDQRLRAAKGKEVPFGGVQIILVADFCQLIPILNKKSKSGIRFLENYGDKLFVFESEAYKAGDFTPFVLTQYTRNSNIKQKELLKRLRLGFDLPKVVNLINKMATGEETPLNMQLETTNNRADEKNQIKYNELKGESFCYHARLSGHFDELSFQSELNLKIGCRVMVTANNSDSDYFNGDLGFVIRMNSKVVSVNLDRGHTVDIVRKKWVQYNYKVVDKKLKRVEVGTVEQMPLKLAYAITIHKSQGLTIPNLSINLKGSFSDGMAYVGLSRVQSFENLRLVNPLRVQDVLVNKKAVEFTCEISKQAISRQDEFADVFGVKRNT